MVLNREATRSDAISLSKVLRKADREEIRACSDLSVKDELLRPFDSKKEHKIRSIVSDQEELLGIYGISTQRIVPKKVGVPWMLATDNLFQNHKYSFMRVARAWLDEISQGYDVLENYAYANNTVHIEWIKAIGFDLVELVPQWGVRRKPFWHFRMQKSRNTVSSAISELHEKKAIF